jgi:hypothetical protein
METVSRAQSSAMRALGEPIAALLLGVDQMPKKGTVQTTVSTIMLACGPSVPEDPQARLRHSITVFESVVDTAAPKPGSKAAASGGAKKKHVRLDDSVSVPALRPVAWLSWDGVVTDKDAQSIATLYQVEVQKGRDSISVSSLQTEVRSTMPCVADMLGRHLPREALMLPNLRTHPDHVGSGVYVFYAPRRELRTEHAGEITTTTVPLPNVAHLRMTREVDMDTEPFGVTAVGDRRSFMPMGAGIGIEVKLNVTQWSDRTHPLKALSFHQAAFDEDVFVTAKLWPNHVIPLFGISDPAFGAACSARWVQNMPLLIVGSVDQLSLKMPINGEAAADKQLCGVQVKVGSVLADNEGFIRTCLPPVTPQFILSCCSGARPLLRPEQYLVHNDAATKTFSSVYKATYCLSTLDEPLALEKFVKDEMAKPAPAAAAAGAEPPSILDEKFTYRVMPGVDLNDGDLPDFAKMRPEEGSEWVKARMLKNIPEFCMVIYGVKGPSARTLPAFAEQVQTMAIKLGLVDPPPVADDGLVEPPAKKQEMQKADPAPAASAPAPPAPAKTPTTARSSKKT